MTSNDCCCICLGNNINDMIITKCNHHIHLNCLSKWLNIKCSCPICRTKINPVDYNIIVPSNINTIDIPDHNGITPLMVCAINGNLETLKIIINLGANLSLRDNNNNTAYDHAIQLNNVLIINYFNSM